MGQAVGKQKCAIPMEEGFGYSAKLHMYLRSHFQKCIQGTHWQKCKKDLFIEATFKITTKWKLGNFLHIRGLMNKHNKALCSSKHS